MGVNYDWERKQLRARSKKVKITVEEKQLRTAKKKLDKRLRTEKLSNSERKALIEKEIDLNIKNGNRD